VLRAQLPLLEPPPVLVRQARRSILVRKHHHGVGDADAQPVLEHAHAELVRRVADPEHADADLERTRIAGLVQVVDRLVCDQDSLAGWHRYAVTVQHLGIRRHARLFVVLRDGDVVDVPERIHVGIAGEDAHL